MSYFEESHESKEKKIKKTFNEQVDRAAKRIYEYGWPISPNIDQLELMFLGGKDESKYNFFDKEGDELGIGKGINKYICDIFKEDDYKALKSIVNNWTLDPFKKREEIWSQCLEAHINENYILSTHTLALQIEGLLEEFNEIYSYSDKGGITNLVENFVSWFPDQINTDLEGIAEAIFNSLIENMKFLSKGTYEVNNESKFYQKLNRHYIAHSKLTNANEVLSLKCFLLLDLIYFAFDLFE